MRVLFRVDASPRIGAGHLRRCLTLAERLCRSRCEILFICRRDPSGSSERLIRRAGFNCRLLPPAETVIEPGDGPPHRDWLGAEPRTDFEETITETTAIWTKPDLVVVDHYGIDAEWESRMRSITGTIAAIDDLADRRHTCDVLVDQTYGRSRSDYGSLVPPDCRLLVGSEFALVREEFVKRRPESLARRKQGEFSRLLISMGGYDPRNLTSHVLEELMTLPVSDVSGLEVDVILGCGAPHLESVARLCQGSPYKATLSVDVTDMGRRLSEADLSIGSGGTISWERCCLGLPTIVITFAENQNRIANALAGAGAIRYLGDADTLMRTPGKVAASFLELRQDTDGRRRMSERAAAIVDGGGTVRVARVLLGEI